MTAESQSTLERAFEIRLDDSPFRVLPGEQVRLCGRRDSCPTRRPGLVGFLSAGTAEGATAICSAE